MKRDIFYEANSIYHYIEDLKEKQQKLFTLKNDIIEILSGHTEIPEEKVINAHKAIDELSKCLGEKIKDNYKLIDKL